MTDLRAARLGAAFVPPTLTDVCGPPRQQLACTMGDQDKVETEIKTVSEQVKEVEAEIKMVSEQLKDVEEEIKTVSKQLKEVEAEIKAARDLQDKKEVSALRTKEAALYTKEQQLRTEKDKLLAEKLILRTERQSGALSSCLPPHIDLKREHACCSSSGRYLAAGFRKRQLPRGIECVGPGPRKLDCSPASQRI